MNTEPRAQDAGARPAASRKDFDSRLRSLYKNYPAITDITLRISFRMTRQKKNVATIRAILDKFPSDYVSTVDTSGVVVSLPNEDALIANMCHVVNLAVLIKGTRNRSFSSCGQELAWTEMLFLLKTVSLRNSFEFPKISSITPERLKRFYQVATDDETLEYAASAETATQVMAKPAKAYEGIAEDVARRYREKYLKGFAVQEIATCPHEVILIVEDSFVVDFCLVSKARSAEGVSCTRYVEYTGTCDEDLHCQIQELTHNNLFMFKYRVFVHSFQVSLATGVYLRRFGAEADATPDEDALDARYPDASAHLDRTKTVMARYPSLDLQSRLAQGPGSHFRFIILELENARGTIVRAVGYAKPTFTNLFEKVVDSIEERGDASLKRHGIIVKGATFVGDDGLIEAYLSHTGKAREHALEDRLAYYYLDLDVGEADRVEAMAKEVLASANRDFHTEMQRNTLQSPTMGPSRDVLLYNTLKRAYSEHRVIFDHHPHYLEVNREPLSYTAYICGLNVAIDYRDFYYFACEDYFGNKTNARVRDEIGRRKEEVSREHGVRLVYINYWEDINLSQVQDKVNEALKIDLDA